MSDQNTVATSQVESQGPDGSDLFQINAGAADPWADGYEELLDENANLDGLVANNDGLELMDGIQEQQPLGVVVPPPPGQPEQAVVEQPAPSAANQAPQQGPEDGAASALVNAGNGNVLDRQLLEQLVQVSAQMLAANIQRDANRNEPTGLRPADMKLKEFSGHSDPNAHHIQPEKFLALLRWMQDCKARLSSYKFPESTKVAVLVNHLSGGARAVFNAKYSDEPVHEWSLEQAFHKLAALVPEHKVLFTRKAFAMQFRADNLIDDIKTFELYMRFGDLPPDGCQFIFAEFQSKLTAVAPLMFSIAANEHNEFFAWDATKPFSHHVSNALRIVSVLQTAGKMQRALGRIGRHLGVPEPSEPSKKRAAPQQGEQTKKRKTEPVKIDKQAYRERSLEYGKIAREHGLCFKCSKYMGSSEALKAHRPTCQGNSRTFHANMQHVKKLHEAGKVDEIKSRQPRMLPNKQD